MKKFLSLFIVILTAFSLVFSVGCKTKTDEKPIEPVYYGNLSMIGVNGKKLCLDGGKGKEIVLRGVNAGGYLVTESWMCAVNTTHKNITQAFMDRFGEQTTLNLWAYYRENFWADKDFERIANTGMNVIRLPFTYMTVDPDYHNVPRINGEKYNFTILDYFIDDANYYGLYVILDMHGAYGSQNGQDHSGETMSSASEVDFYSNEQNKAKTTALWKAIAERYKNHPGVAGYDLLNEPGEKAGDIKEYHWNYFDELYKTIRSTGDKHVIFIESCWTEKNLPYPETYGWTDNVSYSFHHYTKESSGTTDSVQAHYDSWRLRLAGIGSANFNLPILIGEFTCYGIEKQWQDTLDLIEGQYGYSWTSWTYKVNSPNGRYLGWGLYMTKAEKVDPWNDSVDQIKQKWAKIRTSCEDTYESTISTQKTLSRFFTEYIGK